MKLFIFHFRPLENYPPILNFLRVAQDREDIKRIYCFSASGDIKPVEYNSKIKLIRIGNSKKGKLFLWITYCLFAIQGLFYLLLKRPNEVLYYETLSMFPVYLYLEYFSKQFNLYIHFHEYVTPAEFVKGSIVERFYYSKENSLLRQAKWISHTNKVRLSKFLNDENIHFNKCIHHTLPNYPSRFWSKTNIPWKKGGTLKLVYVGHSLTAEGNYLEEVVRFLKKQSIPAELNLFCFKTNDHMKMLAGKHGKLNVILHNALPYQEIPSQLQKHHIGLILYKAKTQNYLHNAPNKLFEYLSCGLDVWYPSEMQGIYEYDSAIEPRVIRVDFSNFDAFNRTPLIQDSMEEKREIKFYAEDVYSDFIDKMIEKE